MNILAWFLLLWAIGIFLLVLVRGYLNECDPTHSLCEEDSIPFILLWPIIIAGLILFGIIAGPFYAANWFGGFVGRRCGCFRRKQEK